MTRATVQVRVPADLWVEIRRLGQNQQPPLDGTQVVEWGLRDLLRRFPDGRPAGRAAPLQKYPRSKPSDEATTTFDEPILSLPAMARRLGVTHRWLRDQARKGRVPSVLAGGRYLFAPDAVLAAVAELSAG